MTMMATKRYSTAMTGTSTSVKRAMRFMPPKMTSDVQAQRKTAVATGGIAKAVCTDSAMV